MPVDKVTDGSYPLLRYLLIIQTLNKLKGFWIFITGKLAWIYSCKIAMLAGKTKLLILLKQAFLEFHLQLFLLQITISVLL